MTLNTINGYPAVTFSDQGGVGGDFLGYNRSLGITGSDAATVVIVARNTTAADRQNRWPLHGTEECQGVSMPSGVTDWNMQMPVRFGGQNRLCNDGHTAGDWKIIYYTNPAGASVSAYGTLSERYIPYGELCLGFRTVTCFELCTGRSNTDERHLQSGRLF
ncbi:MAG: hypothetical protein R2758_09020 [Bacteroidales bacterium]